ncbi:MAG: class III lanthionine synthetase LanKC [Streptosporangiaceae bacterium]
MDGYELYCLTDPVFYDRLDQHQTKLTDFSLVSRPVPDHWIRHDSDSWMYCAPADLENLPDQGWKVHVSARLSDAERTLEIIWDYCTSRAIAFKYLRGEPVLVMHNSKSADRAYSGKLVTIYPQDEAQLELVLKELHELLRDVEGPYILSDLRYADGPLYVRYGGFTERHCLADNGERVLAIRRTDGELVPDLRTPSFATPSWVTLPAFLQTHLDTRNAVTTIDLPYDIESVIQFSNGGGVYLGKDRRTGDQVVLKEARPHAGLDIDGRDAIARLRHERDILQRLTGLEVVPEFKDYFQLGEHEFLVQEFIDGNPLQRQLVQRYPLTSATCTDEQILEYSGWVTEMLPKVDAAVQALHDRGVVFGDLHPNNILLSAEGRLVLIDFEVATLVEDEARAALAHPAFVPPPDRVGVQADHYALACLVLGLFAPQITITLPLHRAKAHQLGDLIAETFPVPRNLIDAAVRTVQEHEDDGVRPGEGSWPEQRAAMHRAILASATPDRQDRLFPGDIAQFQPGGAISIAHGAAGVLLALAETGAGRFPEYEDWLCDRARQPGSGLGFYTGLHGAAYVLDRLGRRQDALDIVGMCLGEGWEGLELGLHSGLAGIGLNLLNLGVFTDLADDIVQHCADRLGGPEDVGEVSGGEHSRAGLMHGSSGPALLFLRAYELSGDRGLLARAADALRQDLRRCLLSDDGSLQVNQGWRRLPYLEEGSAGIALVLARYLRHHRDEEFAKALQALRLVARSRFFVQSGLFNGRAGIIAALEPGDPELPSQISGLRWHALPYGGGLAYPGEQLLRLSMDFATGTAGVLYALEGKALPLIEQPDPPTAVGSRHPADRRIERFGISPHK